MASAREHLLAQQCWSAAGDREGTKTAKAERGEAKPGADSVATDRPKHAHSIGGQSQRLHIVDEMLIKTTKHCAGLENTFYGSTTTRTTMESRLTEYSIFYCKKKKKNQLFVGHVHRWI